MKATFIAALLAAVVGLVAATPKPTASPMVGILVPRGETGEEECLVNPSNLATGALTVEEGCTKFTTAVAGDTCYGILGVQYDPDLLSDFYMNNPSVGCGCYDLQIGTAYCVADSLSV